MRSKTNVNLQNDSFGVRSVGSIFGPSGGCGKDMLLAWLRHVRGFDHATGTLRSGTLQQIQLRSFAPRSFSAIPCAGNNMGAQPVEINAPRAATTIAQQVYTVIARDARGG